VCQIEADYKTALTGSERPEITSVLNERKTSQWTNLTKMIIR
ncbi:hypothetical protein CCACVL1_02811, partial [Corchorus capsularis]